MQTSMPGVFAAGDVRVGSGKRVASAVGEGATVMRYVHEYLGESATAGESRYLAGRQELPIAPGH